MDPRIPADENSIEKKNNNHDDSMYEELLPIEATFNDPSFAVQPIFD